jgi:DNA-binding GntR family transcriptional regulator
MHFAPLFGVAAGFLSLQMNKCVHMLEAVETGNVYDAYERLRADIVSGALPAGSFVNQVAVARTLRISRTPLREALRLLEAQGFITAEHQHRMRVAVLDAESVDTLYASRILLESMGVALSVPTLDRSRIAELHALLERLDAMQLPGSGATYAESEAAHRAFHSLLCSGVGAALFDSIQITMDHANRFRIAHNNLTPNTEPRAKDDHHAIVAAVEERAADRAAFLLSRHLGESAIGLLATVAPQIEPRAVRAALRLTAGGAPASPALTPRARRPRDRVRPAEGALRAS